MLVRAAVWVAVTVVLQGLLLIAELGREEGDLDASVSLPTSRNPVS